MSSSSFRSPLKIVGLLALPLLSGAVVGCAADDEDEHAAFPGMSGIPGDPTQQVAASEPPSMRAPSGQSGVIPTESTVDPGAETAETQIGTAINNVWFIAFAPATNPRVAIAVTLEHVPGQGAVFAAPVARQVLEVLLHD